MIVYVPPAGIFQFRVITLSPIGTVILLLFITVPPETIHIEAEVLDKDLTFTDTKVKSL